MKKYLSPETMSLKVNAQTVICASGGPAAPGRQGSVGTMTVKVVDPWV